MSRRKMLVPAIVLVLTPMLLAATSVTYHAYALAPPPPSMEVVLHFDVGSARGFEKEVKMLSAPSGDTPEFVLKQGETGSINLTFTAVKAQYFEGNATGSIRSIFYGGLPPFNTSSSTNYGSIPEGITYNIEPRWNIPITPSSNVTVTLQISAAPNTAVRSYYLNLQYGFEAPGWEGRLNLIDVTGYNTILTVVEGAASTTSNNTTKTTTHINNTTITTTSTFTQTSTSTTTTTLPTTITITNTATTTSTLTETSTEPSTIAWAVSATVAAVILAAVLLLQRIRK